MVIPSDAIIHVLNDPDFVAEREQLICKIEIKIETKHFKTLNAGDGEMAFLSNYHSQTDPVRGSSNCGDTEAINGVGGFSANFTG